MNIHAFLHIPDSNYCYAYDTSTLHIRLRTAKNDAKSVTLRYGDPYQWQQGGGGGNLNADGAYGWVNYDTEMKKEATTDHFDYWIVAINPEFRRARYGFIIKNNETEIFYGEGGIFDIESNALNQLLNYFNLPFLNAADVFKAPSWVKDTIWYQIFPERFANGNPLNDPAGVKNWGDNSVLTWESFYGGDIDGITKNLDYLSDLGITGIYLNPIFKSPSTHKYDTADYYEIDPSFGTKDIFKNFVDLAHQRGIKIMLDLVVNHCGYNFAPWQDVLQHEENSIYKDWFHIREFPVATLADNQAINYDAFAFVKKMPKMKTENPEVSNFFLDVARYWTKNFNIDGWRLDVSNEVDHAFWREFRKEVRKINPECYILGEIWHDSNPWLKGDQFDAVMNYPLTNAILDYIAKDKSSASKFVSEYTKVQVMYSQNVHEVSFNLLGSHDTARVLTIASDNKKRLLLAYQFMFTLSGSPCIYYGDEIGMDGGDDPGCRKCMIWDEQKQDLTILEAFKQMIKLRKDEPALRSTKLNWLQIDDEKNVLVYEKRHVGESVIVILNNSGVVQTVELPINEPKIYENLITKNSHPAKTIELQPFELILLK